MISIGEAADLCQVTAETIRRWVDQGEIPSTRTLGGHRRIDLKDFQEFLRKRHMGRESLPRPGELKVLVVGSSRGTVDRLVQAIRQVRQTAEIVAVSTCFEAGQRLAVEGPDYVFFLDDTDGLNMETIMRAVRGDAHTRMTEWCSSKRTTAIPKATAWTIGFTG
ncbi:MAG: helix-turn-helix domain-containing protein [Deltaproteobacteria bacterium]|nr:helix-turn-helix domain-containing protein [Deltaproteobacteria bacterium]